jgi:hypothetical protein
MSAGAALSSFASRQMIRPGAELARAAQETLTDPRRAEGKWPFQWDFPGPESRPVMQNGSVAIPPIPSGGTSASGIILQYTVPEGYRFRLKEVVMNAFSGDWQQGSGQLLFTLQVLYSTGPRNVDFLTNVAFGLGSGQIPWPIHGRLEFDPRDVLQMNINNFGIPAPAAADFAYGALNGFVYPNSEL